jgi:aminoglycoside 3'-phosphotransferase II
MPKSANASRVLAALPRPWQEELAGARLEAAAGGEGGASVFRVRARGVDDRYLKRAKGRAAKALCDEIERTAWLSERGVRVPRILRAHSSARQAAALVAAMPGVAPQVCGRPAGEVVAAIAGTFAGLHALPAKGCPFDETIAVRLARARADVRRGAIDPKQFDPRNRSTTSKQLYERLAAARPVLEDIVVVHGDATFDNILIDAAGHAGLIDCGNAGRADRYVDLSLIAAEVEEHFGTKWVAPFVRAYGLGSWDAGKARYFLDLYELF